MKKLYVIGLIVTTLLIGIHFVVIREALTVHWVLRNLLVTFVSAHIYLGYGYLSLHLARGWTYRGGRPKVVESWLFLIVLSGAGFYLYILNVGHMDTVDFFQNSDFLQGTVMLIIGALMEQTMENKKEAGAIKQQSL